MATQLTIDITSDIHISHWITALGNKEKLIKLSHLLIQKLLPENPSDILIIAGDIGHFNWQDKLFFEILKDYYKKIVWTHGNHDLYMVSKRIMKEYHYNSFERLNEKIGMLNSIDGVHYLNGNIVEIDGIKIGGCGMWYNNDYAKQVWGKTNEECEYMWNNYLNDACAIVVIDKNKQAQINNLKYFKEQYKLLKKIYLECDVIVTHISPDWSHLISKWRFPETTFYHFDGSKLLKNLNENTIWIFGHTHDKYFYQHENGCTMICNPLDYGMYDWPQLDLSHRKFVTMSVGKLPSYEDVFINSDHEQKNNSIQKRPKDGNRV